MSDGKVVIDIDGDPRDFQKQINGLGGIVAKGLGGAFLGAAKGLAKVTAAAGAALGAVLIGGMAYVAKKGWDRALNIEDAKATLKALGYTSQQVKTISDAALQSVLGTKFAFDDAMKAATTSLAAGIKPGKELQGWLALIADTAQLSGASFSEVALVMNQVQAKGRLMGEEILQLGERGIPILQWLAADFGVTGAEMSKMVSKGEVDAKRFAHVMEKNLGGTALEASNTVRGAWENVQNAISRVGEQMFTGALGPAKDALKALIGEIDAMGPDFELVGRGLISALGGGSSAELEKGLSNLATKLASGIAAIAPVVINVLAAVIVAVAKALPALLPQLASAFVDGVMAIADVLPEVVPALLWAMRQVIVRLAAALPEILPVIAQAFVDVMMQIADVLPVIIPPLIEALQGVILTIAQALPQWLPLFINAIVVIITTVASALGEMAPTLIPIIYECMIILVAEILKALPLFLKAAFDLIGGLIKGFDNNQSNLLKVVKEQALGVLKSWLDSVPKMLDAGKKLLIGIKDGAVDGFNTRLVPFLKGLGNAALDALGNLGNTLKNAGIKLLQGLWDGALEKWKKVKEWVSSIAEWIADHKGPLNYDYKLLQPAGRAIMRGLQDSLASGFGLIERDLKGYTADLGAAAWSPTLSPTLSPRLAAAAGGGSRIVTVEQNIYQPVRGYAEQVRATRDAIEAIAW